MYHRRCESTPQFLCGFFGIIPPWRGFGCWTSLDRRSFITWEIPRAESDSSALLHENRRPLALMHPKGVGSGQTVDDHRFPRSFGCIQPALMSFLPGRRPIVSASESSGCGSSRSTQMTDSLDVCLGLPRSVGSFVVRHTIHHECHFQLGRALRCKLWHASILVTESFSMENLLRSRQLVCGSASSQWCTSSARDRCVCIADVPK